MATVQFKDVSPYKLPRQHPPEDYIYGKYVQDVTLQKTGGYNVIGIALFGVGRAGSIHLTSLVKNPRVKLLYIVDDDQSKWKPLKDYWNLTETIFLASTNASQVFNDENVDAVVVASPTHTHEQIVTQALDHKKAVFCEKPVAEDIEKTRKCFEKAKKVGMPLLTAFNRRFDPAYSTVRERVRKGEVGHVTTIKVCSRDSPLPTIEYLKQSGGIFHDCAVHDIDMIIWILGEYPSKVSVSATANIPEIAEIGDHDTVAILLTFPSGTIGVIDLSRNSNYGYDQRLEVFGFKGMVRAENQQPVHGVEFSCGLEGLKRSPIFYSFPSRYQAGYINETEHFLNVLQDKEKLSVDPKDVLAVTKIASACEEAARTGRIIELNWNEEDHPQYQKEIGSIRSKL
ncbi:uncharacterized protein LOC108737758 [Agrilus planipennis]|uniref:Uncharacterized protein LOC108737758 n=1 Tax=Agrilus planipennis TaxID=224129 RepID=A0A7F5RFF0_AGRPL|nr:uncharacterized protein LOC108737758 [Agrilus planipennis]